MICGHTSVFVVVGKEEGPFSAPKALEAPMGELGPEPGALLVGVESTWHQRVRISMRTYTPHTKHVRGGLAKQLRPHNSLMRMVFTDYNGLSYI